MQIYMCAILDARLCLIRQQILHGQYSQEIISGLSKLEDLNRYFFSHSDSNISPGEFLLFIFKFLKVYIFFHKATEILRNKLGKYVPTRVYTVTL